jgi:hypothetical protein
VRGASSSSSTSCSTAPPSWASPRTTTTRAAAWNCCASHATPPELRVQMLLGVREELRRGSWPPGIRCASTCPSASTGTPTRCAA